MLQSFDGPAYVMVYQCRGTLVHPIVSVSAVYKQQLHSVNVSLSSTLYSSHVCPVLYSSILLSVISFMSVVCFWCALTL